MESFFLAETTKYLYLLFDTENFMHNQGNQGTVIETPNGQCVIQTGGYIFNTEAHPIDPSALYCCHDVPKMRLFDFKEFRAKQGLFRGETLEETSQTRRKEKVEPKNLTEEEEGEIHEEGAAEKVIEETGDAVVTTIQVNDSYQKLEDNDSVSVKINGSAANDEGNVASQKGGESVGSSFLQQLFQDPVKSFDPQQMLERIRKENKYFRDEAWQQNYKILSCKAQPFLQRISIMGEFFNV